MPRKSKIDTHGLGPKIIAYAQSGMYQGDILKRMATEHPEVHLTPDNISKYLASRVDNTDKLPPQPQAIREITERTFKDALMGAINEAKAKYSEYQDDPKAGWAWFKHYLETLDRMGKVAGAYTSDQPTVNVQVNSVVTSEALAERMKAAEDYFKAIDAKVVEHD